MPQITINAGDVVNTFSNTDVNVIAITEDKLINILTVHVNKMKKSKEWLAALSFAVSLLLVLLTSKFERKWGLSGEQWQIIFILLFLGSIVYFLWSLYNIYKHKVTVDIIVQAIKNGQE